jgi:hypothetical protein
LILRQSEKERFLHQIAELPPVVLNVYDLVPGKYLFDHSSSQTLFFI